MQNIVLVGFMGTGKSVVGRLLARDLKMDFLETDDIIESKEEMPIKDIFETKSEPYFRMVEKEVIREASLRKNAVISAGGGAILDEENFKNLKTSGTMIYLRASCSTILKRTKGFTTRPLLNVPDAGKRIEELLAKRESCYNKADFSVNTDSLTIEQVVEEIIKTLTRRL